jgi:hypothetical protein
MTAHIDMTPTPAGCRHMARLFKAQQARAEALAARAEHALDALDGLADGNLGPWERELLAAAFEALYDAETARGGHMRDALAALGPHAHEQDT